MNISIIGQGYVGLPLSIAAAKAGHKVLGVDINYGDYIGYFETENRMRYYTVNNDGRVVSDNKHNYAGTRPFYRTIFASPVVDNEFRGL